ncbi:hypothetical protein [Hymenobacter swuensis]|uniref:Uncharacterized protein n=1 Tax=Hymenobacter swuensis DY53 TaxID=1227739 RepID=W8F227_9BACT|nr:hypothetical protein [Hymenobacter swuensis]AHJ98963.1 hypothetical protein Hsw_3368 [Hymenobacter swuensis DY53]
MESLKTESQRDKLNRLFKEYGLLNEDVHKHQHYTIIRRTGIEKIAAAVGIRITFEVCAAQADYAAVKATAKKPVGSKFTSIETFGSACKDTSQNKYYLEMAEKRALSRAVLKLSDLYAAGAYGEDESDDFSRARNPEPAAEATRPTQPAAPAPTPPASPQMVVSAAAAPSSAEEEDGLPMDKLVVLSFLNEAETLEELQAAWVGEAKGWHLDADVFAAKESRKAHLQANQSLSNAR